MAEKAQLFLFESIIISLGLRAGNHFLILLGYWTIEVSITSSIIYPY